MFANCICAHFTCVALHRREALALALDIRAMIVEEIRDVTNGNTDNAIHQSRVVHHGT